jgi:hypothetical protein
MSRSSEAHPAMNASGMRKKPPARATPARRGVRSPASFRSSSGHQSSGTTSASGGGVIGMRFPGARRCAPAVFRRRPANFPRAPARDCAFPRRCKSSRYLAIEGVPRASLVEENLSGDSERKHATCLADGQLQIAESGFGHVGAVTGPGAKPCTRQELRHEAGARTLVEFLARTRIADAPASDRDGRHGQRPS